jgi:hypothetical protein
LFRSKHAKARRKELLLYSVQYMVTNGSWALFMLNDVFILGLLIQNASMIASYKVAYAIPGNISLISKSIGVLMASYYI